MNISGNDTNVEPAKGIEDTVRYNLPNMIPMENSVSMVESSACSSAPMVDTFCPPIWDQSINGQSLGYCDINVQTDASPSSSLGPVRTGMDWTTNGMFLPNVPRMLPHNLPHFPSDSAFIQRAAKFSCFNGRNFCEMVNPFSIALNPHSRGFGSAQGPDEVFIGNDKRSESVMLLNDEAKNGVDVSGTRLNEAEFSGRGAQEEPSGKRKKRKKTEQKTENNETPQPSSETAKEAAERQNGDQIPSPTHGSDPPKEEYIHIRARRGQATNSHSLAERVRREKISERMKFLQDLVPGCSKVTGKAVMLDEIINYVQSLQRQVEFLSMKLATVNPRVDFNIERFLAKDIPQPRTGLSSSLAFAPDVTIPFPPLHLPHPPHPGLIPASLPTIGNCSETLQRPVGNVVCGRFNEPTSQVLSIWNDELHNVVHNSFNPTACLNSQDLSDSLPPDHMKAEP